eukprot:GHVU01035262.1.p2 GENE.GHVU01035262.1~~GHVU01035262.1.p2  ORF type:complete len:233 (-),score=9.80 GHVU01035262.1:500-1198(-)
MSSLGWSARSTTPAGISPHLNVRYRKHNHVIDMHMICDLGFSGNDLRSVVRDVRVLDRALEWEDVLSGIYGVEARWERERELGYVDVLPDDHGTCIHECQQLLHAWFAGPRRQGLNMDVDTSDFLLVNGSLLMEVYVCMVNMRAMPYRAVWDYAAYWARAVQCLYILYMHGEQHVGVFIEQLLHGDDYDFAAFEWRVRDRVARYHHLHGVIRTEDRNGYSPCNSATFSDTDD